MPPISYLLRGEIESISFIYNFFFQFKIFLKYDHLIEFGSLIIKTDFEPKFISTR